MRAESINKDKKPLTHQLAPALFNALKRKRFQCVRFAVFWARLNANGTGTFYCSSLRIIKGWGGAGSLITSWLLQPHWHRGQIIISSHESLTLGLRRGIECHCILTCYDVKSPLHRLHHVLSPPVTKSSLKMFIGGVAKISALRAG